MKNSKDGKGRSGRGEDEKLWDFVIRSVTPLTAKGRIRQEQARREYIAPRPVPPEPMPPSMPPSPSLRDWRPEFGLKAPVAPSALLAGATDRRTAERLRRGDIPVEAVLDLHGLRQGEAQAQFFRFIQQSARSGRRCVLVITGKGGGGGEAGVLRRGLPLWIGLPAIAGQVLDFSPAKPRDGGDGAFYILLRRQR